MSMLVSKTSVRLAESGHYMTALADHLGEHGLEVTREADAIHLSNGQAAARLTAGRGNLDMTARAGEESSLEALKYMLASHLGPMARDEGPEIVWHGAGAALPDLPNFRALTVRAIRDVTPRMRRITLSGNDLFRFDTTASLHVKLLLPQAGGTVRWPRLGADGLVDWGPPETSAVIRRYTLRRVDPMVGEIDIDFVRHADAGPGSRFAEEARPGDTLGLMGPGGGSAPRAGWNLFVGDETALPAIARLVEAMPDDAKGHALIEVEDPGERQTLRAPAGVKLEWLCRSDRAGSLLERSAQIDFPDRPDIFAWAAAEFAEFRSIRVDWRRRRGLSKDRHQAVAYWRRGWDK
ncbi:siderophore-interacting protein [Pararhizobium mangrovi]|nr:siderophore-interacting protein [Pararhizobium mangrovi]